MIWLDIGAVLVENGLRSDGATNRPQVDWIVALIHHIGFTGIQGVYRKNYAERNDDSRNTHDE